MFYQNIIPTTYNKNLRSKKFFLCVHQCTEKMIGFELAKERFTQFTFLSYGYGKFHFFDDNYDVEIKTIEKSDEKKLYDLREYINCNVVAQSKSNTKIISFNPWKKYEKWNGRLIDVFESTLKTDSEYACIICLEGTCNVNGKEFVSLDCADIIKGEEYQIHLNKDSYVGLFELVSQ